MAAAQRAGSYTIKTIWGLAKSPELSLDKDSLYALMERETGKDSMQQLTQAEINRVCGELMRMKDAATRAAPPAKRAKRSDEGGNPRTAGMRRKIFTLAQTLGWTDDDVNKLAYKIFGISRQEWLDTRQCSGIISALQKMVDKNNSSEGSMVHV